MSLMQAALRRHRRLYRHEQAPVRATTQSAVDQGPLRSARVGPNSATSGVPTAAAMCSGPVSPEIRMRAGLAIANRSAIDVAGAGSAAPSEAAETCCASGFSLGPQSTTERLSLIHISE